MPWLPAPTFALRSPMMISTSCLLLLSTVAWSSSQNLSPPLLIHWLRVRLDKCDLFEEGVNSCLYYYVFIMRLSTDDHSITLFSTSWLILSVPSLLLMLFSLHSAVCSRWLPWCPRLRCNLFCWCLVCPICNDPFHVLFPAECIVCTFQHPMRSVVFGVASDLVGCWASLKLSASEVITTAVLSGVEIGPASNPQDL